MRTSVKWGVTLIDTLSGFNSIKVRRADLDSYNLGWVRFNRPNPPFCSIGGGVLPPHYYSLNQERTTRNADSVRPFMRYRIQGIKL